MEDRSRIRVMLSKRAVVRASLGKNGRFPERLMRKKL